MLLQNVEWSKTVCKGNFRNYLQWHYLFLISATSLSTLSKAFPNFTSLCWDLARFLEETKEKVQTENRNRKIQKIQTEYMNTLVWNLPLKDIFFLIQSLLSLFLIDDRINSTSETRDSLGDYKKEKNKQTNKKSTKSWTKFPTRCKVKLVR